MAKNNNWTKEQTIVAFNIYCKIPFKNSSSSHPEIIKYAKIIGRTPSALNMKIGNFGRLDPELKKRGIIGLSNGSKLEEEVWNEFNGNWDELAFKSELIIAEFENRKFENQIDMSNLPEGADVERIIKSRVNQAFFRNSVLASYNLTCCITGLKIPELLIASHIIPWRENRERTNPKNGLCLNTFHDKAFDKGFITVTPDLKVKISSKIKSFQNDQSINDFFLSIENKEIILPDKFYPSFEFLEYHNANIFLK